VPALAPALARALALGVGACSDAEPALARGDRLWADSNFTAALAEYRLALEQDRDDEAVMARVAHAFIQTGQFERARELYDTLIARSPQDWADEAVFDYVTVARRARDRSDRYGMAGAVEAALALRPGLPLQEMAMPLARYYATTGAPDRAIEFYERALTQAPADSIPTLLFELGEVHEARGNCDEALGFFNAYRARRPGGERADEARWHVGNCSFILARRARQTGDLETALRRLDTVLDLGLPQNLQDQAWFEHGETLLALGRRDDALSSFIMVLELNRARTGQLVERAQRRIDELRFGRPPDRPDSA
jgi:tetratricopeptide (TPR) repeat protein